MRTPIAANTDIVVGSATTWPTICSRWLRPKRVKSGMLSESVAQKPIIAVSDGTKTGKNSPSVWNLPGCASSGPRPFASRTAHTSSTAVMTSTNGAAQFSTRAQQVHAAVDDEDVEAPEEQEREPLGRRCGRAKPAPSSVGQPGTSAREERLQRLAADPGLDAEPAAGDERAHQRRQVRAERAVGGAREDRERDAVLRARVRVEQDRDEHDRVAEQDRDERLPPVHARGHEARREHVGRDAVRHADPQRRVVVGGPVAPRDRHRREVVVVERARLDRGRCSTSSTRPSGVAALVRRPARSRRSGHQRPARPAASRTGPRPGLPFALAVVHDHLARARARPPGAPFTTRPSYGL